jgi:hypothetical protein
MALSAFDAYRSWLDRLSVLIDYDYWSDVISLYLLLAGGWTIINVVICYTEHVALTMSIHTTIINIDKGVHVISMINQIIINCELYHHQYGGSYLPVNYIQGTELLTIDIGNGNRSCMVEYIYDMFA